MKAGMLVVAFLLLSGKPALADAFENHPLRPSGIEPLEIGMTLDQARKATGLAIELHENVTEGCNTANVGNSGLVIMLEGGKITRISFGVFPKTNRIYSTPEGIRPGDSEDKVIARYKTHINSPSINADSESMGYYFSEMTISHHTYNDTGHYIAIKDGGNLGYMFETGDDHTVTNIHAGLFPSVRYVEGCL